MSATRLTCSRNSSIDSERPAADPTSSARFSRRPSASIDVLGLELVEVARSLEQRPRAAAPGPSSAASSSSASSRSRNCVDALDRLAADPGLVGAAAAPRRTTSPVAAAQASSRPTLESPTPRLGMLRTRLTLTSSDGLTTALQVGEGVLDLAPVVEAGAADDLVRDADAHEVLLEHAALRVGAVEDGDVAPAVVAVVVQAGDLAGDPLGLVALVVGVVAHDRLARRRGRSTAPWACARGCWR